MQMVLLMKDKKREAGQRMDPCFVQTVVGHLFGVDMGEMCGAGRGNARIAFARQVAMYLLHVVCERNLADVAAAFGRDRTTASHACHVIEDMRDDPFFDRQMAQIERVLIEAARVEIFP